MLGTSVSRGRSSGQWLGQSMRDILPMRTPSCVNTCGTVSSMLCSSAALTWIFSSVAMGLYREKGSIYTLRLDIYFGPSWIQLLSNLCIIIMIIMTATAIYLYQFVAVRLLIWRVNMWSATFWWDTIFVAEQSKLQHWTIRKERSILGMKILK